MSRSPLFGRLLNASCRDMARLASESLDRDPSRLERLALRSHIAYCKGCRHYVRQISFLRAAMRRLADLLKPAPVPVMPEDVRARIKQAIRDRSTPS